MNSVAEVWCEFDLAESVSQTIRTSGHRALATDQLDRLAFDKKNDCERKIFAEKFAFESRRTLAVQSPNTAKLVGLLNSLVYLLVSICLDANREPSS